ncbi:MAG TPA: DUF4912 domain-containing protein [Dissulfurispiraceae bacterium]|nr:DUF4912 domain-containing protein [Dissulfurispiraceae bacterium]
MLSKNIKPKQGRLTKKGAAATGLKRVMKAAVKGVSRKTVPATNGKKYFEKDIAVSLLTEQGDLPKSYGTPKIVLMPIDPYLANVYWEINAADIERICRRLKRKFNQLGHVLRIYDLAGDSLDMEIDLQSGNLYVTLPSPGNSYFADLGIKTESAFFFSIVRSNTVKIPHIGPRPEVQHPIFVSRKQAVRKTSLPFLCELTGYGTLNGVLAARNERSFSPGISSSPDISEQEK